MKIKHVIIFKLIVLSLYSCESFLDRQPVDSLAPTNYYDTEQQLNSALAGVYDALGKVYASTKLHHFNLDADAGCATSNAAVGVHAHNSSPSDPQVIRNWNFLYSGINLANLLLENIDKNNAINGGFRDRIRGEALFLRAYFYFILVKTYGGVPLRLQAAKSPDEIAVPRSTALEVYTQVLMDMEEAETLVLPISDLGFGGRVNQSAVRAVLARANLYLAGFPFNDHSRYEQVKFWTEKIINDANASHSLNPSYADVFINYAADKYDIKESIWEVEYWGNLSSTYNETGQVGVANGVPSTNPETGMATGGVFVTGYLYEKFKDGDLRKFWAIPHFNYATTGPSGSKTYVTNWNPTAIWRRPSGKFRREYEEVNPKGRYASPQNFPLVRFSDVLLMYAEAENELNGPTEDAVTAVNAVRKRAWSTGIKSITITDGGSGYTSAPSITFEGGGGEEVIAEAIISEERVVGVEFLRDPIINYTTGRNYQSPPDIIFTGGGGSNASAVATIYSPADFMLTSEEAASKESLREVIQDERLFELCFELLRKQDLIRWGIYVERMQFVGQQLEDEVPTSNNIRKFKNVTAREILWPIPTSEMTLNPAIGDQNPGW